MRTPPDPVLLARATGNETPAEQLRRLVALMAETYDITEAQAAAGIARALTKAIRP